MIVENTFTVRKTALSPLLFVVLERYYQNYIPTCIINIALMCAWAACITSGKFPFDMTHPHFWRVHVAWSLDRWSAVHTWLTII